jgi:hypothetical protein
MAAAAVASWNFILYSHDFISLRSPFPLSAPFSGLKDLLYAIISVEIEKRTFLKFVCPAIAHSIRAPDRKQLDNIWRARRFDSDDCPAQSRTSASRLS